MKPGTPPLQSARLLDQVRERIRHLHYSLKTEKAYIYWIRFCIRWSAAQGGMPHPYDMGNRKVAALFPRCNEDACNCYRFDCYIPRCIAG